MKTIKPGFLTKFSAGFVSYLALSTVFFVGCSPNETPAKKFYDTTSSAVKGNNALPANSAPVPVIDALPNVSVKAGETFSVSVRARDSEGGALKYTLACPAELGGLKESDSGTFTNPVGSNVISQEVDCGAMARNKYAKVAQSVFKVSVSGKTQNSSSSNPSSEASSTTAKKSWVSSALGSFNPTAVLKGVTELLRGGSRSSAVAGTAPIYDAWNITPKAFDGFAFDKSIIDLKYQIPDADYSSAWTSSDFSGFKYNEFFQDSNFKFPENSASANWNTTDLGFNYESSANFKNYWPTTGTFGTESLYKYDDTSPVFDTNYSLPTTDWTSSWNTTTDLSK